MQYSGRLIGTWPVCRVASREWKRARRSALRHSRPQCKLLPSLKADGLLSHVPEVIKKGPRTCGRRELGGTEKSIHVHPFIIVILFLRTLNIDIDILFMHQALITPAYFVHIKIPTNSVPTQLAC